MMCPEPSPFPDQIPLGEVITVQPSLARTKAEESEPFFIMGKENQPTVLEGRGLACRFEGAQNRGWAKAEFGILGRKLRVGGERKRKNRCTHGFSSQH